MRLLWWVIYACIPVAFVVHFVAGGRAWEPTGTFVLSALGLIPMARLMGVATAQLSDRAGPTWGGLLNATFGNACELIIGIVGLSKGLTEIVKATLTGSILGNLLLVSGGAMLVGGWNRESQRFSRTAAQTNSGLLAVAVCAMLFPAIFHFAFSGRDVSVLRNELRLSVGTSLILLAIYALGLLFTLKTHAHFFTPRPALTDEDPVGITALRNSWTIGRSSAVLCIASVVVAALSELLIGAVEPMAASLRWNQVFVGVIVIAVVGNAAEHSTAIYLARRNDMETAMTITYQSSLQIALFATPVLVLLGALLGGVSPAANRMDLIFSPMEVAAVLLSVAIVIVLGINGETNWFEGTLLLGVYAILAISFFYIPV
jgi:Ca2+:H+ antiporter